MLRTQLQGMKSKASTPRITPEELAARRQRAIEEIKNHPGMRAYVIDKHPTLLSKGKITRAIKLIIGEKFVRHGLYHTDTVLRMSTVLFANECFEGRVDFRELDIHRIMLRAGWPEKSSIEIIDYLVKYAKTYSLLLDRGIPVHLADEASRSSLVMLTDYANFFGIRGNEAFRSGVITDPEEQENISQMSSEIEIRNNLLLSVPVKILELCTLNELRHLSFAVKSENAALAAYYKDNSIFDTNQPEIYISRLRGLLKAEEIKSQVGKIIEESKVAFHRSYTEITLKASAVFSTFSSFFANAVIHGQVKSSEEFIKKQIKYLKLAAGAGEIDIPVNHLHELYDSQYIERFTIEHGEDTDKEYTRKMFGKEFKLINFALRRIEAKYHNFYVDSRFEMIVSEVLTSDKLGELPSFIKTALESRRENRRDNFEDHVTFKFPPDHMWECRREEAINTYFVGFLQAYENWSAVSHDRSGLSVFGVAHIKLNFLVMPLGGCLKGMITSKIGKCVWVPKNKPSDPVCFWQCLAAGLNIDDKIMRKGKGNNKLNKLTDKLIEIYYTDIGKEPKREMIPLCDVPRIAKALEINIIVYTLVDEVTNSSDPQSLKVKVRKVLAKYDAKFPRTVMLHFHYEKDLPCHYCLINTLVGYGQVSKDSALLECERCGKSYAVKSTASNGSGAERYHKHVKKCEAIGRGESKVVCKENNVTRTISKAHEILGFDIRKTLAVYFDFESTLIPRSDDSRGNLRDGRVGASTNHCEINRQEANAYVLKVWDNENKFVIEKFTRRVIDPASAKDLADYLFKIEWDLLRKLEARWDRDFKELVSRGAVEYIKNKKLRAAAIKDCSKLTKKKLKTKRYTDEELIKKAGLVYDKAKKEFMMIPVYAYNGGHYDYNLLMKYLRKHRIEKILNRTSDFLSFDYGNFRFMDCRNFVPPNYGLQAFANAFGKDTKDEKDIFPYRFVSSFEKLQTRKWPSYEWFEKKKVKEEDYNTRKAQFEERCKSDEAYNLGQYMLEYCEKDVDLLMSGMNGFADLCFEAEKIDAFKFCTIAQLAFAILICNYVSKLGYKIKTIPDNETHDVIEKTIFGGNCQMFKPHMIVGKGEIGFELDMTNMYGKAMRMVLPYRVRLFKSKQECPGHAELRSCQKEQALDDIGLWLEDKDKTFVEKYLFGKLIKRDLKQCGYVRCNLSFTKEQQDKMHIFPPLPMKRVIDEKELSQLSLDEMQDLLVQDKAVMSSEKLVYDFTPKVKYDIYTPALKFLIANDMVELGEIYDYVRCDADYVMEPFIIAMTERRIEAQKMINEGKETGNVNLKRKGETLKDFYKLINNSSYGKTIQNDAKFHRTTISTHSLDNVRMLNNSIITDSKVVAYPDTKEFGLDDEGMAQISSINPRVKIKAPKHMGAAILWNSKMVMLNFLYNCLLEYCPEVEIYYTDTDSVHVKMKWVDASPEFVKEIAKRFGKEKDLKSAAAIASLYSRFPEDVRSKYLPSDCDDIVAGKMKVDAIFFEGAEGIYLKAKTYLEANKQDDGKMKIDKVRDKGVSLAQNAATLTLDHYRESLYEHTAFMGENQMIRKIQGKREQHMASVIQKKWILDPFNDKRYKKLEKDGTITTYPYGYYELDGIKTGRLLLNLSQRIHSFMRKREELKPYISKIKNVKELTHATNEELEAHLTKQFSEGMSWSNYGLKHQGWNMDHVLPVSKLKMAIKGNGKVDEEALERIMAEICDYRNLRPMWKKENSAKGGV